MSHRSFVRVSVLAASVLALGVLAPACSSSDGGGGTGDEDRTNGDTDQGNGDGRTPGSGGDADVIGDDGAIDDDDDAGDANDGGARQDGGGSTGDAGADAGASTGGEPARLQGILAEHNAVRATVKVGAMTWNDELAATAQAWADTCTMNHNDGRSKGHPYYVGENIFFNTSRSGNVAKDVVGAWVAEKANYDYASNTCAAGKVCGHYTQVVWKKSVELGCGIASNCTNLKFPTVVVCNYGPGGNITGEKPY